MISLIIIKLTGGLGNQMFQYATGRSLAEIKNTELKIDKTSYEINDPNTTPRKYELNNFNIIENFIEKKEVNNFKKKSRLSKILPGSYYYIREKKYCFNKNIFNIKGNIYLDGYWQSEKYFMNIKNLIKEEFKLRVAPNKKNNDLIDKIQSTNAVAIHIRRGDYVTDLEINKFHGICSINYYKKGIDIINNIIPNVHYYIFSDDPEWSKKNLVIDTAVDYINHNSPDEGYLDLRLMRYCKHFIIANSSFSWWGAWLSDYKNKIVIAPKKWFNDPSIINKDLRPRKWIKI